MIDSKSPKFVEKLQQSLSLGHSRTTREVWSSKKKLTTKRRWSIQAALILSLNKWWTPNPNKNKTKTLPVFPVLSPYSSLIPKLPNSTRRCDVAPSLARKWCDHWFLWWLSLIHPLGSWQESHSSYSTCEQGKDKEGVLAAMNTPEDSIWIAPQWWRRTWAKHPLCPFFQCCETTTTTPTNPALDFKSASLNIFRNIISWINYHIDCFHPLNNLEIY